MKIVINKCYGGFSLSASIMNILHLPINSKFNHNTVSNIDFGITDTENPEKYRADSRLINAIELIGTEKASGSMASLKIVEIPEDVQWEINDYDGVEWIAEEHRTWS